MNRVTINEEMCKECEYCIQFCPKKTILTKKKEVNKKGYHSVIAEDLKDCIACGICGIICPEGAITVEKL